MLVIVTMAALVVGSGWGLAQEAGRPKAVTIPFELVASNHIVVRAKVNGKGPFRLVFDLGAPVTLLGNKAAEESGAVAKDAPKSFLMGMRGEGKIETLDVGDLSARNIPVIVLDHPTLKVLGGFLGRPLDGIIGFTFFARYRTTIDYQAKTMILEPVDFAVKNLLEDLPNRLAAPKVARRVVIAPGGLWGLELGEASGDGVTIRAVSPGSPADQAGLKPGDLLTELDGRWTTTANDVFAAVQGVAAGKVAKVVVIRDGKELRVEVRPVAGI
jgi:membrane-associated protease RseP (regulator of RpoE activity)